MNRGFSLYELLVVIAILVILLSIIIGSFSSSRERTRDDARIAQLQTMSLALQEYHTICKSYPAELDATSSSDCGTTLFSAFVSSDELTDIMDKIGTGEMYYAPLTGSASGSAPCYYYHAGVTLENTGRKILAEDDDYDSKRGSLGLCSVTRGDFDGADPIFDIKQP